MVQYQGHGSCTAVDETNVRGTGGLSQIGGLGLPYTLKPLKFRVLDSQEVMRFK